MAAATESGITKPGVRQRTVPSQCAFRAPETASECRPYTSMSPRQSSGSPSANDTSVCSLARKGICRETQWPHRYLVALSALSRRRRIKKRCARMRCMHAGSVSMQGAFAFWQVCPRPTPGAGLKPPAFHDLRAGMVVQSEKCGRSIVRSPPCSAAAPWQAVLPRRALCASSAWPCV